MSEKDDPVNSNEAQIPEREAMTVREAGRRGGKKVKELIEEGKRARESLGLRKISR
ncbi:MAG: hypothetical protein HPY61_08220 [Methanotrichaceae archaeon]|nr:hypothetical protein [Methanotrichaceae archaeon]